MIVLDDTAITATVHGHTTLARWSAYIADHPGDRLYAPALCLIAAGEAEPVVDTIAALPGIYVSPLDLHAVDSVQRLMTAGTHWRWAHAIYVARTSEVEGIASSLIITASPQAYRGTGCTVADLRTI